MKKNVYIHITESLCSTEEINIVNQLYFNKINFKKFLFVMVVKNYAIYNRCNLEKEV